MDVHEITTEVKDHTSIYITCEYDALFRQTMATAPHLRDDTSAPHATATKLCNVTVCSSQKMKEGEEKYGKLDRNLFHPTVSAQDRAK